jgi:NAD(P)-dependent dehydrogenase (short-subunit alcohol dehydrogenase family)
MQAKARGMNMPDRYYILVTGASKGIGRATALYLDQVGYYVFAGVRKETDADALRKVASERLKPLLIDVTDLDMIEAARMNIERTVGADGLYGLVNNAGIAVPGPLEFLPLDDFIWQFEVNVTGKVALTQAMLPLLRRATGRVIMMSSISGRRGVPFAGAYSASKHALEAIADVLRQELDPWGLQVVSILPGVIDTPIWETTTAAVQARLAEGALPSEAYTYYGEVLHGAEALANTGKDRGIPPQVVADAVLHALTATTPRTRYYVGRDAKIARFATHLLPDRWLDRLLRRR